MLPYTAYDIVRAVNHEVDLTRSPVREHNHAFGDESVDRSGRSDGGGRGLFAFALAIFSRRPRRTQPAPQPLS
jgi:hypothetical protein